MTAILPDLGGPHYLEFLSAIHAALSPQAYLEIGTRSGDSLALASCASVAIDPQFLISSNVIGQKPLCLMFQGTSDDYFARQDPKEVLGRCIDFAFLDGLHLFEALLRDVMNTERFCHRDSLVAIHDCIPTDIYIAERKDDPVRRSEMGSKPSWWTGDVWKIVPILKRWRPDITMIGLDCAPTGLLLLTNLSSESRVLSENYQNIVDQFAGIDLAGYGLERFHSEMETRSAASVRLPVRPGNAQPMAPIYTESHFAEAAGISVLGDAIVHRLTSPAFTMTYPNVWHADRVPEDVLRAVEQSWRRTQFPPCEVTISLLKDVVVAEEGLVFTRALDLLQPSLTQHSADEVERARVAILGGMKSGNIGHLGGTAVLCKKRGSHNYGHWMMEMLPKAFLVRRHWPRATGYIVQATSGPLGEVIAESLSRLGIERNAVLAVEDAPVHVDQLLLVDGLTSHGAYMSPLVMECIETIASDVPPENMKHIFALRGDLPSRRFVGEDGIRALAVQRGYTVVDPAKMSLVRQIACFKGASRIVGAMGAAMTNIVFCQPGTEVFCLTPANMADTFFWFISGLRNLRYTEVRCEQVLPLRGPMPWDTDLVLSQEDKEMLFASPAL